MKTPLLILVTALGTSLAFAQEPPNPPEKPDPIRPPDHPDARPRVEGQRREEGVQRRLGGRRLEGGDRERGDEGRAPMPEQRRAYLGVITGPVEPALAAQLGLTEGLGLVVESVMPDSPAAKAGVQAHDILKKINDQWLTDPAQLATLVRHFGKDAEVTLKLVRKGQEQTIATTIGEHLGPPDRRPLRGNLLGDVPRMPAFDGNMETFRQRLDEWQRDQPGRPRDGAPPDRPRDPNAPQPPRERRRADGENSVTTTWNTASARASLKDDAGEIEVRSENGKRSATIKNAKGETIFDGSIDTEEQRQRVPEEFRRKLERLNVQTQTEPKPRPPGGREEH